MKPDVVAEFRGDYKFLSNFSPSDIEVKVLDNRMRFTSGEHAFQAMKADFARNRSEGVEHALRCAKINSPGQVKEAGRRLKIDVDAWDAAKDKAMREVTFSKYLLSADLCSRLLGTGTAMLVEGNDWGDTYWGRCNGKGLNRLGSILMEVRGYWIWAGVSETYPRTEREAHILMGW